MCPNTTAKRRLSPLEKGLWLIDKACRINFVVHARVRGEINDQIMRRVLDALQDGHPLLGVRIERDSSGNVKFSSGDITGFALTVVERPRLLYVSASSLLFWPASRN